MVDEKKKASPRNTPKTQNPNPSEDFAHGTHGWHGNQIF
jgi:hypothetical protein